MIANKHDKVDFPTPLFPLCSHLAQPDSLVDATVMATDLFTDFSLSQKLIDKM